LIRTRNRKQTIKARRRAVRPGGKEIRADLQRIECRLNKLKAGHQSLPTNRPEVR
jgi:hypothetical protein